MSQFRFGARRIPSFGRQFSRAKDNTELSSKTLEEIMDNSSRSEGRRRKARESSDEAIWDDMQQLSLLKDLLTSFKCLWPCNSLYSPSAVDEQNSVVITELEAVLRGILNRKSATITEDYMKLFSLVKSLERGKRIAKSNLLLEIVLSQNSQFLDVSSAISSIATKLSASLVILDQSDLEILDKYFESVNSKNWNENDAYTENLMDSLNKMVKEGEHNKKLLKITGLHLAYYMGFMITQPAPSSRLIVLVESLEKNRKQFPWLQEFLMEATSMSKADFLPTIALIGTAKNEKIENEESEEINELDDELHEFNEKGILFIQSGMKSAKRDILSKISFHLKHGNDRSNEYFELLNRKKICFEIFNNTAVNLSVLHGADLTKELLSSCFVKKIGLISRSFPSISATELQKIIKIVSESTKFQSKLQEDVHKEKNKLSLHLKDLNKYEEKLKNCIVLADEMSVKFADIGSLSQTKTLLQELISWPLQKPELFQQGVLKGTLTGILLFGPPGTGKTMLAKAVACESQANFLNINMSNVADMYLGESEKNVRAIFSMARRIQPCVIFIDEIDSLLSSRNFHPSGNGASAARIEIANEFMSQWDGLKSKGDERIIVMGATNRPFALDDAVLRRMPRRVLVDMPNKAERNEILQKILKEDKINSNVSFDDLAAELEGYSGSDLRNLCMAAALNALRRLKVGDEKQIEISKEDFVAAKKEIAPSVSSDQQSLMELRDWNKQFGVGASNLKKNSFGFH